jgi:hypothetical protein
MHRKLPVIARPSELRYDQGEVLESGAQFIVLDSLPVLKSHWAQVRSSQAFAACGTGSNSPALFLGMHEWIFAPTVEALVAAVTRWDEFKFQPRWYDRMSEEFSVHRDFQARRAHRRAKRLAEGRWTADDEMAYEDSSSHGKSNHPKGFWRLSNLPCGLSHFDWFSEYARPPTDPNLSRLEVDRLLRRMTFDDWRLHQTQDDVHFVDASGMDAEIAFWEQAGAEQGGSYEDV